MSSLVALLRSAAAVLLGYVVFAASAFSIFQLAGRPAHAPAPVSFMLLSTALGVIFAAVGGYVAAWIAGRHPRLHGGAVGVLLAIGAGVSLAATLGHGAVWSQVAALTLMAPAAVAGGWLRARHVARRAQT